MALPSDIDAWILKHRPCFERADRLSEHASMWHAWEASTHGPYLFYMLRSEGKVTEEVLAVRRKHAALAVKAKQAALPGADRAQRLQDQDADYAAALAAYAIDLKAVADNPFQP